MANHNAALTLHLHPVFFRLSACTGQSLQLSSTVQHHSQQLWPLWLLLFSTLLLSQVEQGRRRHFHTFLYLPQDIIWRPLDGVTDFFLSIFTVQIHIKEMPRFQFLTRTASPWPLSSSICTFSLDNPLCALICPSQYLLEPRQDILRVCHGAFDSSSKV